MGEDRRPLTPKETLLLLLLPLLSTFLCLRLYLHLVGVRHVYPGGFLDEVTYLVATKGTDADYVSRVSLFGAIAFESMAVILLLAIYKLKRK
jgi:hypothetical protein